MNSLKTYWQNCINPAPNDLPDYAAEYITSHLQGQTILDFGIGEGRLLPLYKGFAVTGYDIVPRELPVPVTDVLYGHFDCVVASKVFLHIPPDEIEPIMRKLQNMSGKVIVYDTVAECGATHNWRHNFHSLVRMRDWEVHNKDLLFWYE